MQQHSKQATASIICLKAKTRTKYPKGSKETTMTNCFINIYMCIYIIHICTYYIRIKLKGNTSKFVKTVNIVISAIFINLKHLFFMLKNKGQRIQRTNKRLPLQQNGGNNNSNSRNLKKQRKIRKGKIKIFIILSILSREENSHRFKTQRGAGWRSSVD